MSTSVPSNMTDMYAGVLRQGIQHDLRTAKAAAPLSQHVRSLADATAAFYAATDKLDADLTANASDPLLSDEGREARRQELGDAWTQASAQHVADATAAAKGIQAASDAITIKPPESDAQLLEAKLSNARSDARMLLDPVNINMLPKAMSDLVQHGDDPIMSYLLAATEWGSRYLRSRNPKQSTGIRDANQGNAGMVLHWEHMRRSLTPHLLSDTDRRAWERQQQLSKLPSIPSTLSTTRAFLIRSRRLSARGRGVAVG